MTPSKTSCSVCRTQFTDLISIGGLRRSRCQICGHSERVDIPAYDYTNFAMGGTGLAHERLKSQADFISPWLPPQPHVLELGCATGGLAATLRAQHVIASYDGVELSPARHQAMTILDRVFDAPIHELLNRRAFDDKRYDLAIASHYLEHIPDPGAQIDALLEILDDNGVLFIEVPNRSGHRLLPFDDNRSHIHFFSVASLSRLLIDRGLQVLSVTTGAQLDQRYSDSLRVIARRSSSFQNYATLLSNNPALSGSDKVIIWGAGGMTDELLAHFFDPARIACFIDKDPAKQGATRLGATVVAPAILETMQQGILLINSIEAETAIRAQIATDYPDLPLRIVGLSTLLEG